jgi:hypothetical protein
MPVTLRIAPVSGILDHGHIIISIMKLNIPHPLRQGLGSGIIDGDGAGKGSSDEAEPKTECKT